MVGWCLESTCSYSCSESHRQREHLLNCMPFPFPVEFVPMLLKDFPCAMRPLPTCCIPGAQKHPRWSCRGQAGEGVLHASESRPWTPARLPQVRTRSGLHCFLGVCPLGWPLHWPMPPLKGLVSRSVKWLQMGHRKSLQHMVLREKPDLVRASYQEPRIGDLKSDTSQCDPTDRRGAEQTPQHAFGS